VYEASPTSRPRPRTSRPSAPARTASSSTSSTTASCSSATPTTSSQGLPYLDRLVFRVIPDANTRLLALERGELDFIGGLPAGELDRVDALPDVTYAPNSGAGGGFCVMTMAFNLERERFADRAGAPWPSRTRSTGSSCSTRCSSAAGGRDRPDHSQLPSPTATTSARTRSTPAEAERAARRGRPPPRRRRRALRGHLPALPGLRQVRRGAAPEPGAVGVELELVALDRAAFITRVFEQRDFDTNVISYCNNTDPAIGVARVYVSTNIGNIPFSNAAAYANPEVDRLFAEAASPPTPSARGATTPIQRLLTDELPLPVAGRDASLQRLGRAEVRGLEAWSGSPAERAWIAR
jgi:peptide/nickel transport system substrate-binding protein